MTLNGPPRRQAPGRGRTAATKHEQEITEKTEAAGIAQQLAISD